MNNLHFHGDTVDLTDHQRSVIQEFLESSMNMDSYEELARKLVATSDESLENIISVGIALHTPYSPEGMDATPHERGGESMIAFEIDEICSSIEAEQDSENKVLSHWSRLKTLVSKQ